MRATRSARHATVGAAPAGVSLLEMLLVVALIAAPALLAAAALGGGLRRHAAAVQRQGARRAAALHARAGDRDRPAAAVRDRPARTALGSAPRQRDGDIPEALGVTFTGAREAQPSAGEGAILFFADGASTGGRIAAAGRSDARWNIDVAWLTGEVRLRARRGRRREPLASAARCRRGYTLIEVIVAFALLALALTLLLGTLSGATRQVRWAGDAGRAALHAQSLLDQQGIDAPIRAGQQTATSMAAATAGRWIPARGSIPTCRPRPRRPPRAASGCMR